MIKEHENVWKQTLILCDFLMITACFFLGYYLRNYITYFSERMKFIYPLPAYLNLIPLILLIWGGTLYSLRAYESFRTKKLGEVLLDILRAFFISLLIFSTFAFSFKMHYVSRIFIGLVFLLSAFFLWIERILIVSALHYIRKKGYNDRYVLMVGTGPRAQHLIESIKAHPEWGFNIVGLIDDEPELVGKKILGYQVLGQLADIPELLNQRVVDEVIMMVPRSWLQKIEKTILYCEEVGKRVSLAVDFFTLQVAKAKETRLADYPLLMFQTTSDKLWQLLIKRILDMVVSTIALVIFSPLFLLIPVLIKMTSAGPVFFSQTRSTLNGRRFTFYKFRTMVADAESRLEALRPYNEMRGPAFKMANDPRIIKIGKWMRKFSLDELPQLFHVLMGDMSIVGPRPSVPAEVEKYQPWQRRRLSMRPGLTCLWQIEGRNKIADFDEWMKLDLEYIDHWSLWLDLKICLKTIPVVLFGIGAK